MVKKIVSVLVLLLLIVGVAFAAVPGWGASTFSITPAIENSTADANVVLTYSGTDMNYLCLSTTDVNTATTCVSTTISLTTALSNFSLSFTDSTATTIYAYLKSSDGNYSTTSKTSTFTLDATAPTVQYKNGSAILTDGNAFSASTLPATITVDITGASSNTIFFDGVSATTSISTTGISEGDHNIVVDANDTAGNRLQDTFDFTYDTNAPSTISISSAYTTNYTNDNTPTLTLSATDATSGMTEGKIYLSCSSSGTWKEITYTTSYSDFNVLSGDYNCVATDGNKIIYAKFADKAGNQSSVTNTTVNFDATSPSAPTGLSADVGSGQVTLSWSAPSADNLSGNAGYKVYKNGDLYTSTTSTSATVTGLTNDTAYSFKLKTYDNAGNESEFTDTIEATPSAGSSNVYVEKSGVSVSYAKSGDTLNIECVYSEEVDSAKIYYRYNGQSTTTLKGPTDNISSFNEDITISGSYSSIQFWCEGTASGTMTSSTKTITIDNTLPSISWGDFNSDFTGIKEIWVTATDDESLARVEFKIQSVFYATTKEGNNYYLDVNTEEFDNGTLTLTAVATDDAGNTKEITKSIEITNILTEEQTKQKAINDAKAKKLIVEDLMNYYLEQGLVFSTVLNEKKISADALLLAAQSETDNTIATEKANSAKVLYNEINLGAGVTTINSVNYLSDENTLDASLALLGFSTEEIQKIKELLVSAGMERKLSIEKTGDTYQATIKITFTNTSTENTVKIVEFIPKEFAQVAAKIFSDYNFVILQNDPAIEFSVDVVPGATRTISYGIGEISEEKANALINDNVIGKFSAPPLLIDSSVDTTKLVVSGIDYTMILIGVIAIVIILLIIGGAIIVMKGKGSSNMGSNKRINIMEKIKLPKKEENSGKNRWKHKP